MFWLAFVSVHVKLDTMEWLFLKHRRAVAIEDIKIRAKLDSIEFVEEACVSGVVYINII